MKYVSNKNEFLELLGKSQIWKQTYRILGELISKDISLEKTGENVPFPILRSVYGSHDYKTPWKQHVFCQIFWVGQAYDCWISILIKDFNALPSADWSHLNHT